MLKIIYIPILRYTTKDLVYNGIPWYRKIDTGNALKITVYRKTGIIGTISVFPYFSTPNHNHQHKIPLCLNFTNTKHTYTNNNHLKNLN